jgi:hypothetical protein
MTDPKRLREERAGSWEAQFIDAMRSEKPPARSRRRVLAAVAGAGATTAIGWTARAAVIRVLMNWPVWVGGGSVVALGVAHEFAARPTTPMTTAARAARAPSLPPIVTPPIVTLPVDTPAPGTPAPEAEIAPSAPPPSPRPALAVPRARQESPPTHRPPVAPPALPTSSSAESLKDEIASLYAIKRSLDAHDPEGALRELDAHEQKFSHGTLRTESSVLRVEAWLQIGDTAHAAALGRMIIDESPNGPYARRIRSLLDLVVP